jgi:hypothetical protein
MHAGASGRQHHRGNHPTKKRMRVVLMAFSYPPDPVVGAFRVRKIADALTGRDTTSLLSRRNRITAWRPILRREWKFTRYVRYLTRLRHTRPSRHLSPAPTIANYRPNSLARQCFENSPAPERMLTLPGSAGLRPL